MGASLSYIDNLIFIGCTARCTSRVPDSTKPQYYYGGLRSFFIGSYVFVQSLRLVLISVLVQTCKETSLLYLIQRLDG